MKQNYYLPLFFKIGILLMLIQSCKKIDSNTSLQNINNLVKQVPKWLENQKSENYLRGPLVNIDALIKTADLTNAFLIKRDSLIDYLIVPIKDEFLKLKKFDPNSTVHLIFFVERSNEITDAFMTQYIPQDGKKVNQLPNSTYIDIMHRKPLEHKGRYRYFDISSVLDFQITYDGEKFTTAVLKSGDQKNKNTRDGNNTIKNKLTYDSSCTDWYLVTTHILPDGTVYEDWLYLTTTCPSTGCTDLTGEPVPCRGDGSSGGGGGGEEDIIDEYSFDLENSSTDPIDTDSQSPGYGPTFGPIIYRYHYQLHVSRRWGNIIDVSEAWVYIFNRRVDVVDVYGRPAYRVLDTFNDTSHGFPSPGNPKYAQIFFKCDVFARWVWPTVPWEKSDYWTHTFNKVVKR